MTTIFTQLKKCLPLCLACIVCCAIRGHAQNISFSPTDTICESDTVIVFYSPGCPTTGATYNWTFAGGNPGMATGPGPQKVKWSTTGTHAITVTETNQSCSHFITKNITIKGIDSSQGTFTFTPTQPCVGQQAILAYTGGLDVSYRYMMALNYGLNATPDFNYPTFPDTVPLTWSAPGVYTTEYYIVDPVTNCASDTARFIVTVNSTHIDTFNYFYAGCSNRATVQLKGTPSPSATYMWTVADGGAPIPANAGPAVITWPNAGAHNVTLTVTDTAACGAPIPCTLPVTVSNGIPPTSTFTYNSPEICSGDNSAFTYTGNAPPGATFLWNYNDGNATPGDSSQGPQVVSWPTPGNYDVTLTVIDSDCISTVSTQQVTVNICTGTTATEPANSLAIYPNPFATGFTLRLNNYFTNCAIVLYDEIGRIVANYHLTGSRLLQVNLLQLPRGIYFLTVITSNGNVTLRKVVKE